MQLKMEFESQFFFLVGGACSFLAAILNKGSVGAGSVALVLILTGVYFKK